MENEKGIGAPEAHTKKEKPPRPIRTSKELAESLGYTRDLDEPPTNYFRTYRKDFFPFLVGGGFHLELAFQDVGRGEQVRRERITLGVCTFHSDSGWQRCSMSELVDLAREELEPLLVFNPVAQRVEKDFDKRILREVKDGKSGYDRIKKVIERIESRGYLDGQAMDLWKALSSEYNFGTELSRYLIEQFQEYFPEYPYFLDRYKKEKKVYFYSEREKGKKTVRVIRMSIHAQSLEIQSRRASIQPDPEDSKKFQIQTETFGEDWYGHQPYTVWGSGFPNDPDQKFDKTFHGDRERAREVCGEWLAALAIYLEDGGGKKDPPWEGWGYIHLIERNEIETRGKEILKKRRRRD